MTRILILGAGPAGLGAALSAVERGFAVHVLERAEQVGGLAGGFELDGVPVDFGSHRLDPLAQAPILTRLRELLGEDLLTRPRRERIRFQGTWIHFPPRPLDLIRELPKRVLFGASRDLLRGLFSRKRGGAGETFEQVLEDNLGPTLARNLFCPYARKVWGLEAREIAAEQAHRRVHLTSARRLLGRVLPARFQGARAAERKTFEYPRGGFGQVCEVLRTAARAAGVRITTEVKVRRIHYGAAQRQGEPIEVDVEGIREGVRTTLRAEKLWSTIPQRSLVKLMKPEVPDEVLHAAEALRFRSLVLVYLVLEAERFGEFDTYYFPEPEVPMSRLTEPKLYSGRKEPAGRTVLCAEIPCFTSDTVWGASDEELGRVVEEAMQRVGMPVTARISRVVTRRVERAYPLYTLDYLEKGQLLDAWLSDMPGVLSLGRQGSFVHNHTHHALLMGRAAVDCLNDDGRFDSAAWTYALRGFQRHVIDG